MRGLSDLSKVYSCDKEVTSEELIALSQEIRACAERWDVPYDMLDVADDIEANCYSCAKTRVKL